jgi:hypothetical protein
VVRPVTYTVAPAAPSSTEIPRPAPRIPPATSATFPSKFGAIWASFRLSEKPPRRLRVARNALVWRLVSASRSSSSRRSFASSKLISSYVLGPSLLTIRSGRLYSVPSLIPQPVSGIELRHISVYPLNTVVAGHADAVVANQDAVEAPCLVEAHRR